MHRPDDATDEEINEFRIALEDMGAEGLVDLPSRIDSEGNVVAGWSLSFLEPRSQSHVGFRNLKRAVDTDAAIAVLGQNLTTEVEGGSFAAAQIQNPRPTRLLGSRRRRAGRLPARRPALLGPS